MTEIDYDAMLSRFNHDWATVKQVLGSNSYGGGSPFNLIFDAVVFIECRILPRAYRVGYVDHRLSRPKCEFPYEGESWDEAAEVFDNTIKRFQK